MRFPEDIIAYCIGDEIVCAECFDERHHLHFVETRDNIILAEDLETYESQGTWLFCDRCENCDGLKLKPRS